jgi:hypothetical protein
MAGRGDTPMPQLPPDVGDTPAPAPAGNGSGAPDRSAALREVREQLREILTLLERNDRSRA